MSQAVDMSWWGVLPANEARRVWTKTALQEKILNTTVMPGGGANGGRKRPAVVDPDYWAPAWRSVWMSFVFFRVLSVFLLPIADCDETFNYWEPTHYLMYGKGFQTWEYRCVCIPWCLLASSKHWNSTKRTKDVWLGNVLSQPNVRVAIVCVRWTPCDYWISCGGSVWCR